jgi:hypothetical protein
MGTTHAGVLVSSAYAYRDRLFKLVGDREPLQIIAETAPKLADIARANSVEVLRSRPFAGKWTPNEIIGHLVDGEWVYGYRLRLILCEDHPGLVGTKQDLWVARQRHNEREPSELVEMFRTMREFNLAVWKRTAPAELQRVGQHNERGAESLELMLRLMAGHDLSHVEQIGRYIAAVEQRA